MEWTIETFLLANFILIVGSILQMATGISVGIIIVPFLAMISYALLPVPVVLLTATSLGHLAGNLSDSHK